MKKDVIIVGGGIIGCSIALRLAQSGLKVAVIDRGRVGSEASRAAAGMLSPQTEAIKPGPFFNLCSRSHSLYPSFAEEITELSGIDVEYRREGTLCITLGGRDESYVAHDPSLQNRGGLAREYLSVDAARRLEPVITGSATGAIFLPDDHQVENRRLMDGLDITIRRLGVEVIEGEEVNALVVERDRVTGIICGKRRLQADKVVIAAGCWSSLLLKPLGFSLEVIPARGQMIALRGGECPISHILHSHNCYLVPRRDNRILVGATVEYVGFHKEVTAAGVRSLFAAAIEMVPALKDFDVVESWSGLRPDTPDHLPVMGPGGIENLLLATGHFRNGILLAPLTADLITEAITRGHTPLELEPFSISRFDKPAGLLADAGI